MVIGERLRELREAKKLSQGDIEGRSGLLRAYVSRVENGHTIPSIETLEKLAAAMEIPLYQLMYDGNEPPQPPALPNWKPGSGGGMKNTGKDALFLHKLRRLLSKMSEPDRQLISHLVNKLASRNKKKVVRRSKPQMAEPVAS